MGLGDVYVGQYVRGAIILVLELFRFPSSYTGRQYSPLFQLLTLICWRRNTTELQDIRRSFFNDTPVVGNT